MKGAVSKLMKFISGETASCIHIKNKPPAMPVRPQIALALSKKPPMI